MKTQKSDTYIPNLYKIFFAAAIIDGILSLIFLAQLPASMDKNAWILGLSPIRIFMFALMSIPTFAFITLFAKSIFHRDWLIDLHEKIREFLSKHDLLHAAIISLLLAGGIGGFLIDTLLNPDIIEKAIIYQYLYVRIRPIAVWVVGLSFAAFLTLFINHWIPISNKNREEDFYLKKKCSGIVLVIASLTFQSILGVQYFTNPEGYVNYHWRNSILFTLALLSFLSSLLFFHNNLRGGNE